jgi:hypothetical protein
MLRKRNDSVKRGQGIDGGLGENYTDAYNVPDMQDAYPGNRHVDEGRDIKGRKIRNSPGYAAYTSDDDAGLVRRQDFEHSAGSRQIWRDVEANQNPDGEFDTTGGIRSGVNRSQS